MVVSEFGGVQGLIIIEDVLVELFGDIGDELKRREPGAERLADGSAKLPGSMELDQAAAWLGVRLEGSAATLAGHIVESLGRLPIQGESVKLAGVELTIAEMGPTTVRWIVARPTEGAEPTAEPSPRGTEG
jgi:CBS domain containing-hemolysin-like protein